VRKFAWKKKSRGKKKRLWGRKREPGKKTILREGGAVGGGRGVPLGQKKLWIKRIFATGELKKRKKKGRGWCFLKQQPLQHKRKREIREIARGKKGTSEVRGRITGKREKKKQVGGEKEGERTDKFGLNKLLQKKKENVCGGDQRELPKTLTKREKGRITQD